MMERDSVLTKILDGLMYEKKVKFGEDDETIAATELELLIKQSVRDYGDILKTHIALINHDILTPYTSYSRFLQILVSDLSEDKIKKYYENVFGSQAATTEDAKKRLSNKIITLGAFVDSLDNGWILDYSSSLSSKMLVKNSKNLGNAIVNLSRLVQGLEGINMDEKLEQYADRAKINSQVFTILYLSELGKEFTLPQKIFEECSEHKFHNKQYGINIKLNKDIPSFALPAIWNLIGNTMKYAWDNKYQGKKIIMIKIKEDKVIYQDNGVGVKKKDLLHIFNKDYNIVPIVKTKVKHGENAHKGLPFTYQLVTKRGGEITAKLVNPDANYKGLMFEIKYKKDS